MKHAATSVVLLVAVALGGCSLLVAPPRAEFDVRPLVIYAGDRVDLDGSPSEGDVADYRWEVNGEVEHGRVLTTAFARPGMYDVRLTVEDSQGRTAESGREITVYARSGTRLLAEEFSDGDMALGRWPLDPIWAVPGESEIETAPGETGDSLYVNSAEETLHRRAVRLELPPLRAGQRLVFSVRVMPLRTQGQHGFVIAPGRTSMSLPPGGLPYVVFSGAVSGSSIREPSVGGGETTHFVPYLPRVFEWHAYSLAYGGGSCSLQVDGVSWGTCAMDADLGRGGVSWLVLGDESLTEACQTYFDSVLVSVEE